eukprot:12917582-Prorocentrum_lima.AAC.1
MEDSDFDLTIYFPSQFEKNHVQGIVESMYKKFKIIPTQVEIGTATLSPPNSRTIPRRRMGG